MNLRAIVDAQRKQTLQEQLYKILKDSQKINRAIRLIKNKYSAQEEELNAEIQKYAIALGSIWLDAWIKSINKQLGDPREMAISGLKQHAKPYWNPTSHKLNVFPLGIIKEYNDKTKEITYHSHINPGEHIMVPWGHTVGGKHSSVAGVAPQLTPLPNLGIPDQYTDIMPLSFTEWCEFGSEHDLSECCHRQILWSEKTHKLVCQKCGGDPR